MTKKRIAICLRRLFTIAVTGFFASTLLLIVPEANGGRSDRGSVRNSSRKAPAKGSGRTSARKQPGRAGGAKSVRHRTPRGRRHGHAHRRYSHRRNAWRDWRRFRAITGGIMLGVYLATRPPRTTTVVVTGTTYYYSSGVYYAASGSGYIVVSTPPGAVVYAVPTATTIVYVGTTPYYYFGGAYYVATNAPANQPEPDDKAGEGSGKEGDEKEEVPMTEDDHNYEAVAPPVGATVPYVPEEASETKVNGKRYFVYDGTYYQPFSSEGETIYIVVEDPQ